MSEERVGLSMADVPVPTRDRAGGARKRKSHWLRLLHQWHWISSALCLAGMLLFSLTGITLNHAAAIGAAPQITTREEVLPEALLADLAGAGGGPLPAPVRDWLARRWSVSVGGGAAEWSDTEVYLSLPRPGGDGWLSIDRGNGAVLLELTDRGWIAWLNDLHKGRHTGPAWSWFIDLFAAACLVFCLTGLALLWLHAGHRPATWKVTGLGLLLPGLLILFFIH